MKRVIIVLILHLVVFSLSANAGDIYLSGNIGVGTANENIESISSISGYIEYNFLDNLAVRGSANYYGGESKMKDFSDGEFEMISFESSFIGKVYQHTGVVPYLGLGVGYYMPDINRSSQPNGNDIIDEELKETMGYHVVTGVILNITENAEFEFCAKYIILSADVKRTRIEIATSESLSITDKDNLNTMSLNCGLRFKF